MLFLGPALGPTVGGLLVSTWGWPSIFLVNVPFGVAALLFVGRLRKEGFVDETDRPLRLDPVGLVMLSVGLTAAIYGATEAPNRGWWSHTAPALLGHRRGAARRVIIWALAGTSPRWTCGCCGRPGRR